MGAVPHHLRGSRFGGEGSGIGKGIGKGTDEQEFVQLLRCAYTVPATHLVASAEQHALIVQMELCRDDSDDHACKHLYLMLERQAPESLAVSKLAMH